MGMRTQGESTRLWRTAARWVESCILCWQRGVHRNDKGCACARATVKAAERSSHIFSVSFVRVINFVMISRRDKAKRGARVTARLLLRSRWRSRGTSHLGVGQSPPRTCARAKPQNDSVKMVLHYTGSTRRNPRACVERSTVGNSAVDPCAVDTRSIYTCAVYTCAVEAAATETATGLLASLAHVAVEAVSARAQDTESVDGKQR